MAATMVVMTQILVSNGATVRTPGLASGLACASMLCLTWIGPAGDAGGGWGMESGELHDGDLLAAPRRVERVAITYAQSSKQVGHDLWGSVIHRLDSSGVPPSTC